MSDTQQKASYGVAGKIQIRNDVTKLSLQVDPDDYINKK